MLRDNGHFKCNRDKLTEMPVLWAYARDLFQTPGSATRSTSTTSSATTIPSWRGAGRAVEQRNRAAEVVRPVRGSRNRLHVPAANSPQEFLGDLRGMSQPTISRIVTKLVPAVKAVLEEFAPDAKDAIEMVKGRVVLVDGTITPAGPTRTTPSSGAGRKALPGFNAQLISLLDGTAVFISDPLPGKIHDVKAYEDSEIAEIVGKSGGGFGDKGYQGTSLVTPKKKPKGGKLLDWQKKFNAQVSSYRAAVERLVAHFKEWRIFHADYRRPYRTYRDAFDAARGLFFFAITWGFE